MRTSCWDPAAPTARAVAADVRAGRRHAVDVVEEALARIEAVDGDLGAFVLVDADGARAQARDRAAGVRRGDALGPLHGVPVGIKDLFDVVGQATRAGSRVPGPGLAVADALAVRRLRDAGAVVVGRTRTHEFAWGITTQHASLGGTRNPHDLSRVPGGSSGGAGAAVAAGLVPLALGTDTGCSVRLPAAWCGVLGLKPAHGEVPLDGVVPLAPSLDHGGPLVRDAADARLALEVLTGRPVAAPATVAGLRVGVVDRTGLPVADAVASAVDEAAARLAAAGASVRRVRLPLADLPAVYGVLQSAEALAAHRAAGWWPAGAAAYGYDVRLRLERSEALDEEQLAAARRARQELAALVDALPVDVLLLPVASAGPPAVGAGSVVVDGREVALRDAVLPWTVLANLTGLPAVSLPAGEDPAGLPVGVQVVAVRGGAARVLDAATAAD